LGACRAGRGNRRRELAEQDTKEGPDLTNSYTGAVPPFAARLALVLVGLAWVLPFLSPNFREPISSFYGEATAAVIGLAAFACLLSRSLWAGIELPRSSLVFLGFAGLILLHILLGRSVYLQQNLLAILYLLWATALAMLAWRLKQVFGMETVVAALSWFVVAGTLLNASIGLMQFWGVQSPLSPYVLPQIHGRIRHCRGRGPVRPTGVPACSQCVVGNRLRICGGCA
jgi:hypothetical protein